MKQICDVSSDFEIDFFRLRARASILSQNSSGNIYFEKKFATSSQILKPTSPGEPRRAQESPREPRATAWRVKEGPREHRREHKRAQKSLEKLRKTKESSGEPMKAQESNQESPGEPKRAQEPPGERRKTLEPRRA